MTSLSPPTDRSLAAPRRRVGVLAYPMIQLLDVVGPLEVFAAASAALAYQGTGPLYEVAIVAASVGPVTASSGLQIQATASLETAGAFDTLLVAGGIGSDAASRDPQLLAWLTRQAAPGAVRRLGSVCTGAFLLGAAGLLDGRRAVTHWGSCDRLAARFPRIRVDPAPIFIEDDGIWTSAGVTAGMDLALALVEQDHGHALAMAVARRLVMFCKRPGDQAQFSERLATQMAARGPIRSLQDWIRDHPQADLSVETLAERAAMSPRNFARLFVQATGTTPGRFVERVRLDAARDLLEESGLGVDLVASRCGFGHVETLRRACVKYLGVSPQDYRRRFRAGSVPQPVEEHAP